MDASIREEILSILGRANDMTIATVCQDGYPPATTVSFVNDGLDIYFGCAEDSQKSRNISRNGKVSLTVNLPYADWGEIHGLSAGARAERLTDLRKIERAGELLLRNFPQGVAEYASGTLDGIAFFRVVPKVISVLDYRKGFGQKQLVGIESA
jgi:general stress protein 26